MHCRISICTFLVRCADYRELTQAIKKEMQLIRSETQDIKNAAKAIKEGVDELQIRAKGK